MDILQIKEKLPKDFYDRFKLLSCSSGEEEQHWAYLKKIAEKLFKDGIDFNKHPVFFCITDSPAADACFVSPDLIDTQNLSAITITKGLFSLIRNEEQLAFILSRELIALQKFFNLVPPTTGVEKNDPDFICLEKMAAAGYNINEAGKLIAHILINGQKFDSLAAKLSKSSEDEIDNESRISTIELKIAQLENFYQKQNKDIRSAKPQPLPEDIKEHILSSRHIPTLQQMLLTRKYDMADMSAKQDILIQAIRDFIIEDRPAEFLEYKHRQIQQAVINYVIELRKEMPAHLLSTGNYNLLTGNSPQDENIRKQLWQEATGHEMPESINIRKKFLHAFPVKIIPDENFMEAKEENNFKKAKQQKEIEAGDNLNVLFWIKLVNMEASFANTPNIARLSDFNGFVLNGINNVDLTKIPGGQNILNVLEKLADSHNRIDEAERTLLMAFLHIQDHYDTGGIQDASLPARMRFYNIRRPRIFKKFNAKSFPELNLSTTLNTIGKSLPTKVLANAGFSRIFGIIVKELSKTSYLVGYNSNYKNTTEDISEELADWFYIVNKDGQITDSFSVQEKDKKISDLINKEENKIYQKLAEKIKTYHQMLEALRQNPAEDKFSAEDLWHLKRMVSARNSNNENYKLSQLEYYQEINKEKSSRTKRNRQEILPILQKDFQKQKYESGFEVSIGAFDMNKLKRCLSPEISAFIQAPYNEQTDNLVFDAYLRQLQKEFSTCQNIWDFIQPDFKENRFIPECNTALNDAHNAKWFTEPQLKKYYQALLKETEAEKLLEYGVLMRERVVLPELKQLAAFTLEQQQSYPEIPVKEIDFKTYKPLYAGEIAKKLGFPSEFAQFAQAEIFDVPDDRVANLQTHILLHILTDDKHRFPLDTLAKHPIHDLLDLQKAKLVPFLTTRENYPRDIIDMVNIYQKLYDCRVVDFAATAEFIIHQIKTEPNPQKALTASLKMAEIIQYAGNNTHKDLLLKDNPAFDTSLFGKITAYQKLAAAGAFADDYIMQNRMLENFIPDIEAVQEADIKNSYYDIFISKHHRIADPDLRRRYQQLWVQSAFTACGSKIDDNSSELYNKVRHFTDKLHGHYIVNDLFKIRREDNVNPADRIEIAQVLADRLVSQQKLSALIKPQPATYADLELNLSAENFQTAGFAAIRTFLKNFPAETDKIVDFLVSKGTVNDCQNLQQHMQKLQSEKNRVSAETLHIFYREFWTYPPEAQSVFLNELLLDIQPHTAENQWKDIFNQIVSRMFPHVDAPTLETVSFLLKYYILSRPPAQRTKPLVAMMTAAVGNLDTTDASKSLGKGFRLFLENAGPETVKIGYTLASYTDIPKFIRDEFLKLKPPVIRPPRWEIYEWLDFYKTQEKDVSLDYGTDVWLGKFITSSLYFVTLEKGQFQNGKPPFESNRIIKLLRAGAKLSAENEFKTFETMLRSLVEKNLIKIDLDKYLALIRRTEEKLNIEIDLQTGFEQFKTSQQIYSNKEFRANGYKFKIHIADWLNYGKNWAEMNHIKGYELEKIKNLRYRQAAAKVCFSLEAMNLLSGGRFYHERFGLELRFDTDNNIINLIDIGAAPVVPPVPGDKELLGAVIYRTLERFMNDKADINGFRKMSVILNNEINKVYQEKQTASTYLQECQRGLLALAEFYTDFNSQDFIDSLNNALNNPSLPFDKHIMKGFIAEGIKNIGIFESEQTLLSVQDKEKLGILLFNIYAASLTNNSIKAGNVIKKEIIKMRQTSESIMPLLKIISEKIKDLDKDSLSLDLPKEFMPTIGEMIIRQNVDSAILKGIMKEVIYTVSLDEENMPFSAQDRQEFGRLLYDTFSFIVSENQQGKSADIAETYLMLHASGKYKSEYAARIAAIVQMVRTVNMTEKHHGLNTDMAVKSIILSGKMDKEIVQGTAETFRTRNPNSLTRSVVAKGLELFLTQKQATPDQLKKALIKIFVKKKNALPVLDRDIMTALENPENRMQIVKMMQIYIQKLGGGK